MHNTHLVQWVFPFQSQLSKVITHPTWVCMYQARFGNLALLHSYTCSVELLTAHRALLTTTCLAGPYKHACPNAMHQAMLTCMFKCYTL